MKEQPVDGRWKTISDGKVKKLAVARSWDRIQLDSI